MKFLNLDFLRTFIKITEYGNLTKVAEELCFSQPAVSKQLKALEQEFGTTLLERKQKNIKLTEAGLLLDMYARQVIDLIERAKYDISKLQNTVSGKLSIAASTIPGHYLMPFIAGEFYREFPQVNLNFEIGDTEEVIKKVLNKTVQVGVVGACPNSSQLVCIKFFTDNLILIVPSNHPWAKTRYISPNELRKGTFIWREEGSGTRKSVEKILVSQGIEPGRLKIAMELGSTESVITAVEAGYGVSFVSKWSVQKEIRLGRLKEVEIDGFKGLRDLYLIYVKSNFISTNVEAFINFANTTTIRNKVVKYLEQK